MLCHFGRLCVFRPVLGLEPEHRLVIQLLGYDRRVGPDVYKRQTTTYEVIEDVKNFRSEIGILYVNEFNKRVLYKLFSTMDLEFELLMDCGVYVYMWRCV